MNDKIIRDVVNDKFALYLRDYLDELDDQLEKLNKDSEMYESVSDIKVVVSTIRRKYFELKK